MEQFRHRHLQVRTRIYAVGVPRIRVGLVLHVLYNLSCDEAADATSIKGQNVEVLIFGRNKRSQQGTAAQNNYFMHF